MYSFAMWTGFWLFLISKTIKGCCMKTIKVVTASVVILSVSFIVMHRVVHHRIVYAQPPMSPFTIAIIVNTFEGGNDNKVGKVVVQQVKARMSNGTRLVKYTASRLGTLDDTTRQVDYPDGLHLYISHATEMKSTTHKTEAELVRRNAAMRNQSADCTSRPGETVMGKETIGGIDTYIIHADSIQSQSWTHWRSPALGCEEIQYQIDKRLADGTMQLMTQGRNISLSVAEPDPLLFDPATHYPEVLPSVMDKRIRVLLGQDPSQCETCLATWQRDDNYYLSHR